MSICEVCSNQYDKTFKIIAHNGSMHIFDSFECAIHSLAPAYAHCGCRIVGHGIEKMGKFYCCKNCTKRD